MRGSEGERVRAAPGNPSWEEGVWRRWAEGAGWMTCEGVAGWRSNDEVVMEQRNGWQVNEANWIWLFAIVLRP